MQAGNIAAVVIEPGGNDSTTPMLTGEIANAAFFHHRVKKGGSRAFPVSPSFVRILFLCGGAVTVSADGDSRTLEGRAVHSPAPWMPAGLSAETDADLLEIQWTISEAEAASLRDGSTAFPISAAYADAVQYSEPFKSAKTISRAIIPQRVLPRFAMGSVETYGEDLVGKHPHPLIDQCFFSFPENDMSLLIDDLIWPMKGNTLAHIPLASNHGVRIDDGGCAHYLWLDFFLDDKAADYLDELHKETGLKRRHDVK